MSTAFIPTLEALEGFETESPLVTSVEIDLPPDEFTPPVLVVVDYILDPDTRIFEGVDTSAYPHYTVSEAAMFFFRRSSHWIRLQENLCIKCRRTNRLQDHNRCPKGGKHDVSLVRLGGKKVAQHRTDGGARYYTLSDIEDMARALYEHSVIDQSQLSFALAIARLQGRLWDYV
jgi:hypothetical protein